jgi:hypothetical protein
MRALLPVCALLACVAACAARADAAGKCNADPLLAPQALIVQLAPSQTPAALIQRLATDAAYAERLGHPRVNALPGSEWVTFGYPPLEDADALAAQVRSTGDFPSVSPNGRVCFAPAPPDVVARVVEFYNGRLDHYFYTPDAGEIAAIDAGRVGAGWVRTGLSFHADVAPGCPFQPDTPVYRFAGVPGTGPSSHFFTRDRAECHSVKSGGQWTFEGLPFWAAPLAQDGSCARADMLPLHRVWRPFGETNHRFTTDLSVVGQMVDQGWIAEGAAMCVSRPPAA